MVAVLYRSEEAHDRALITPVFALSSGDENEGEEGKRLHGCCEDRHLMARGNSDDADLGLRSRDDDPVHITVIQPRNNTEVGRLEQDAEHRVEIQLSKQSFYCLDDILGPLGYPTAPHSSESAFVS